MCRVNICLDFKRRIYSVREGDLHICNCNILYLPESRFMIGSEPAGRTPVMSDLGISIDTPSTLSTGPGPEEADLLSLLSQS